jgi:Flp pilus assembly protein TadG
VHYDEDGAAVVEFALLVPMLVVLVFGIVQFSIAWDRQQALHAAAREGARLGALPATTQTQIQSRVTNALDGIDFPSTPTVAVTPNVTQPCLNRAGLTVVVTVEAATTVDIPMWQVASVTITGRGEFRCE